MPIRLYYFETPNGLKPLIMLEELQLPFEVTRIDITNGEQRSQDFLKISPNGKIPALYDSDPHHSVAPVTLFESGSILLYLAEKAKRFISVVPDKRWSTISWLCWQVSALGPVAGQYNHYAIFHDEKLEYPLKRYRQALRRLLHVMDMHLGNNGNHLAGDYSIADISCFPWVHFIIRLDRDLFDGLGQIENWYERILKRPAVKKALETYPMPSLSLTHKA